MTMTHSHQHGSHRRLDVASLVLLAIGLISGCLSYWLITEREVSPLIIVPSVVAATIGATHISKREAPH